MLVPTIVYNDICGDEDDTWLITEYFTLDLQTILHNLLVQANTRELAVAKPNTLSVEDAFDMMFKRYEDALDELSRSKLLPSNPLCKPSPSTP